MTTQVSTWSYLRSASVTWRDTGTHVLVLPPDSATVLQLSGLGAHVWRVLDQPRSTGDLRARLATCGEAGVSLEETMADLMAAGLLSARRADQ